MRNVKLGRIAAVACVALAACPRVTGAAPAPSAPGPLPASPLRTDPRDPSLLVLDRTGTDVPFLLAPILALQTSTPTMEYLKVRVVFFRVGASSVALVEHHPHTLYQDLGSVKLLQTFPVVRVDEREVAFRAEPLLTGISLATATGASDESPAFEEQTAVEEQVLPVVAAWTRSSSTDGAAVSITQAVRLRLIDSESKEKRHLEGTGLLHVHLEPYRDNPRFTARVSTRQERVGYFEQPFTMPHTGRVIPVALRWDLSPEAGPITYLLSRNIPSDLVDAVAEGVLYWNRVFGREVVTVRRGAAPDVLPGAREVVVRWLPWDTGDACVAEMQANPLTGEMLRGEVLIVSSFALSADDADHVLGPARADVGYASKARERWPGRLCARGMSMHRAAALAGAGRAGASRSAARDYLRSTTAHEVGHTLGLRHNFAGSLAARFPSPADHARAWASYVASGGGKSAAITSSSVMDYLFFMDDVLLGSVIRESVLPYDRMAIAWGYGGLASRGADDGAPFCTDTEAATHTLGCAEFDGGANPIAVAAHATGFQVERLPWLVLWTSGQPFRSRDLFDAAADRVDPPDAVASRLAGSVTQPLSTAVRLLSPAVRSFRARHRFVGAAAEQAVIEASSHEKAALLAEIGGYSGVLRTALAGPPSGDIPMPDPRWLESQVARFAEGPELVAAAMSEGRQLETAPRAAVADAAVDLARRTWAATLELIVMDLAQAVPEGRGLLAPDASDLGSLSSWSQRVVKAADGEVALASAGSAPRARYAVGLRVAAAKLLARLARLGPSAAAARRGALATVEKRLAEAAARRAGESRAPSADGPRVRTVAHRGASESAAGPALTDWVSQERAVLAALRDPALPVQKDRETDDDGDAKRIAPARAPADARSVPFSDR